MKLVALLPVRNEDWCLGLTLRALLMWVDTVIVLLHACTDGSADIVEQCIREHDRGRIIVYRKHETEWHEMVDRQTMLVLAREQGATHIVTLDADEILVGDNLPGPYPYLEAHPSVRGPLAIMHPNQILQLPGYNLRNPNAATDPHAMTGLHKYHSNGIWGRRWFSCAFQDDPRLNWTGDRFHHREPMGVHLNPYRPIQQGHGGVMHLWASSEKRLIAKHRLYRVHERLRFPDKPSADIERMYSWATAGRPEANDTPATWTYADVPASWWDAYKPLLRYLDLHAEPWQTAEVERLVSLHGRDKFRGLMID